MLIEGFSLGFLATASLVVAMFFLRFWRKTGDFLFMAFAIAFAAEAVTRTIMAMKDIPDTGLLVGVRGAAAGIPVHPGGDSGEESQGVVE